MLKRFAADEWSKKANKRLEQGLDCIILAASLVFLGNKKTQTKCLSFSLKRMFFAALKDFFAKIRFKIVINRV